jgi:prevent-host-death family protein
MTLTFRNSRGELTDLPAVAATKAKNAFGAVLEQAVARGAVAITRHDAPKAVLMSYVEFSSLVNARTRNLDDLSAEFDDLLARMQMPAARKGVDAAFRASPAQLGRAAVAAAVPPRAVAIRRPAPRRAPARRRARRPVR